MNDARNSHSAAQLAGDAKRLLEIIARKSFRLGEFKLSSGGTSDYYIDCRTTTLDAVGALLTGRVLLQRLRALPRPVAAVGGLTLGADPIVASIAVQSAQQGGAPINAFIVRKAEKTHGTGKRIEGIVERGARVAVVDDVCTTAASTIQALEACWDAGLEVAAVLCLVEREESNGRANLNRAWQARFGCDAPFEAIFTSGDVRRVHLAFKPA
jgi:orotate phosphoribosyltransferase